VGRSTPAQKKANEKKEKNEDPTVLRREKRGRADGSCFKRVVLKEDGFVQKTAGIGRK